MLVLCLVARSCPTLWPHELQHARLHDVFHYLLEFAQTHVHWVGNAMQPSHSLSPASPLHSIFSNISGISKELTLHIRWPKYWHFSFSISLSNECSGRISFRIDWFDLLAVQGILKSLLQHHNLKSRFLSLSLLYDLTLTSVYDYWKNYSKKKKN